MQIICIAVAPGGPDEDWGPLVLGIVQAHIERQYLP